MNATIEASHLSAAMKNAASIVQGVAVIPILSNVRLVASGGKVEITTCDMDIEYHQSIPCKGELALTVSASKLAQIAAAVPGDALITLVEKDGRLTVSSGRSRWTLPILPVGDFPSLPVETLCEPMIVDNVAEPIRRVAWSIYAGKAQPRLSGIFLHNENGATLAATNNSSIAVCPLGSKMPKDAPDVMVSAKFASTLSSLADGPVSLAWDARKIRAVIGDIALTGKLIEGEFPNYRRIIPAPVESPIVIDPKSTLDALRRVRILGDDKTRCVKIDRAEGKIVISSEGRGIGDASEEAQAECVESFSTGLDGGHLASILDAIGGDSVEVHQAEAKTIMMVRRVVNDGAMALAMPMRI
jgi:DNA polymerase-3 subunit beta